MPKANVLKKTLFLGLIAAAVTAFFATGLHQALTLENIKASQAEFLGLYDRRPLLVLAAYLCIYIPCVALSLPGATVLGLAAGALFGSLTGTVVVSFASTVGATLACAIARYFLRDFVQDRFGRRLKRVHEGIRREGAFYLFSMRLIPVIPFFVINLVMGLTRMRLRTFAWVSQLGMLPGTFVFVNAGSQIAHLDSLAGIVSPKLLLSFALLGLFPLAANKALTAWRRKTGRSLEMQPSEAMASGGGMGEDLRRAAADVSGRCTRCGACAQGCAWLQVYGDPKTVADRLLQGDGEGRMTAFECSLCNLCASVCPEKISPADLFLAMRRDAVAAGEMEPGRFGVLLGYEARGNSPRFSWYGLPQGCDTVFFPGCTLPGTRPETTWSAYRYLKDKIPGLGVVLDCCDKPSHDLGRQDHFLKMFGEMKEYMSARGVRRVVTACPNCHKVFKAYAPDMETTTVYECMAEHGLPPAPAAEGVAVVHDPCPLRREHGVHQAVRSLASGRGLALEEMKRTGERTLCCGEGGAVGFVRPEFARKWGAIRKEQAAGRKVLTYCAGCAGFLSRHLDVAHLLDLVFFPKEVMEGKLKPVRSPFTYLQRLALKKRFRAEPDLAPGRERPCPLACTPAQRRGVLLRKVLGVGLAALAAAAVFLLVSRHMHLLDSYVYTLEFHGMFLRENILTRNVALFADYFRTLGPLAALVGLVAAQAVQTLAAPLAGTVLPEAFKTAFGTGWGAVLGAAGAAAFAALAYGLGKLLLGDILPLARGTRAPYRLWLYPALAALAAVPLAPVAVPAVAGAFFRLRLKSLLLVMLPALVIRTLAA